MSASDGFDAAIAALLTFLEAPLTATIAQLEYRLADHAGDDVRSIVESHGITADLLSAALIARERLGRISDVIHAAAIVVVLPYLLEPDELLRRPSLAAGNDPTRPFDVETDRRIAEFKLARWRGADAMRKRQSFKDLVELAAEPSTRQRHLFVLGHHPIHFLRVEIDCCLGSGPLPSCAEPIRRNVRPARDADPGLHGDARQPRRTREPRTTVASFVPRGLAPTPFG